MSERIVPLEDSAYEVSWERRIILLALVLALLSFAGCVTLSVLEIVSLSPQKSLLPLKPRTATQVQPTIAPPVAPIALLPDTIDEFMTNARHSVPGYETYMAEAIYQPEGEELAAVTPVNSYVKITFLERAFDAEKAIRDDLVERYPEGHQTIELNGQKASMGYEQNKKSFFVGWSSGAYAIEIDTSFVSAVSTAKSGTILPDSGTKAAAAIQKFSAEALAGKK